MISEILAAVGIAVIAACYPPPAADFDAPQEPESVITVEEAPANDDYAAETAVSEWDSEWDAQWDTSYCEPAQEWTAPSDGLTQQSGVNYHDGRTETYYSSSVLYHYRTPEWTLDEEGFYRDADGYYVVAASDLEQGAVFEGSKGECKVYDCGCADGVTDYYTNWG